MELLSPSYRRGTNWICPPAHMWNWILDLLWLLLPLFGICIHYMDVKKRTQIVMCIHACTCIHIHTRQIHYWVHPANQVSEGSLLRACQQHHLLFSCLSGGRIAHGLSHQDWWQNEGLFRGPSILTDYKCGCPLALPTPLPGAKGCGDSGAANPTVMAVIEFSVCLTARWDCLWKRFDVMLFGKLCQTPLEITGIFLPLASAQSGDESGGEERGRSASKRTCWAGLWVIMCRCEWADGEAVLWSCPQAICILSRWQVEYASGTSRTSPPISSCQARPGQTHLVKSATFPCAMMMPSSASNQEVRG